MAQAAVSGSVIGQLASAALDNSQEFENTVSQPLVSAPGGINAEIKAKYDAEPKVSWTIPTPESWRAPFPYAERVEINGVVYHILGDVTVELPLSVAGVLMNKRAMNQEVNRMVSTMSALASYTHISQVPHYMR